MPASAHNPHTAHNLATSNLLLAASCMHAKQLTDTLLTLQAPASSSGLTAGLGMALEGGVLSEVRRLALAKFAEQDRQDKQPSPSPAQVHARVWVCVWWGV